MLSCTPCIIEQQGEVCKNTSSYYSSDIAKLGVNGIAIPLLHMCNKTEIAPRAPGFSSIFFAAFLIENLLGIKLIL